jgi:hypothetical protein
MAYGLVYKFNPETGAGILTNMGGAEGFAFNVSVPSDLKEGDSVEYSLTSVAINVRRARQAGEERMRGFE